MAGNYFFGSDRPTDNTITDEARVVSIATSGALTGTQDSGGSMGGKVGLQTSALSGVSLTINNPDGAGNLGANASGIRAATRPLVRRSAKRGAG